MTNRAARRSEIARFRHEVAPAGLVTHLVPVDEPLDGHPLLKAAARYWRSGIATRKPICFGCGAAFAGGAEVGAWLFASSPSAATACSVSGLCDVCWRDLPMDQIEHHATRVLRQLLPSGRFEPQDMP